MEVKAFVTKYAYWLFLGGLSALLCGAVFADWQWAILIYLVVGGVLLTPEQLVATWLFLMCFDGLVLNFSFIHYYLIALLMGHYVYNFSQRRQAVNWRLLLVTLVFSLHIILTAGMVSYYTGYIVFCFVLFFLVYEQREKMHFTFLLKVLAIGLIISGVWGLLGNLSPYWCAMNPTTPAENGTAHYAHDYFRFQGVTRWATQYAGLATVVVAGLLLAKYQKRLNNYWFYVLFLPVFIFGYQTLTRTFLLCVLVALVIFAVAVFLRDRWQAWRTLVPLAGVLVAVVVIFFTATMGNFERIFHDEAMVGGSDWDLSQFTDADWAAIKQGNGEKYDYLGRRVMWSLYATDFTGSITNFFFGRGMHVLFAGHTAHNWYLFFAWRYGIIGILLFGTMLWTMANWRHWRTKRFWLRLAPCLIFVIPLLLQGMFDDNGFWAQMGIILTIVWCREQPRLRVAA